MWGIDMRAATLLMVMMFIYQNSSGQTNQVHSFYSGFALLRDCGAYVKARQGEASDAEIDAATICAGYVMGVADAHDEFLTKRNSAMWCPPMDVTVGQVVNRVHRYIVGNPEQVHLSASNIIQLGLQEAYPCQ